MRTKEMQTLYNTWAAMIQRCENKNSTDYPNWGGRGIKVCERWRTVSPRGVGFANFVADMGMKPEGMSLDRIDNNGNYEPGNCRWATRQQQTLNSRYTESLKKAVKTHADNMRARTHCKYGHEFTEDNTYIHNNTRTCKLCKAAMGRFLYFGRAIPITELMYPIGRPGRRPKEAVAQDEKKPQTSGF